MLIKLKLKDVAILHNEIRLVIINIMNYWCTLLWKSLYLIAACLFLVDTPAEGNTDLVIKPELLKHYYVSKGRVKETYFLADFNTNNNNGN